MGKDKKTPAWPWFISSALSVGFSAYAYRTRHALDQLVSDCPRNSMDPKCRPDLQLTELAVVLAVVAALLLIAGLYTWHKQRRESVGDMKYYLAASALGAGWMVVLLLAKTTSQWIKAGPQWSIVPLVLGSLITAYLFRRWIISAKTFKSHLLRATAIPYAGTLIYLTLLSLQIETQNLLNGANINMHNSIARYMRGTYGALLAFYVVIPYGLLCQVALNRIGNEKN